MQLNDILEENSIKAISQKTKISEDNLENLLNKNFDAIKKIKTLGFISIIEREYNADLTPLKEEAKEYYRYMHEDQSVTLGLPIIEEEKKGKSKFFILAILALLGYASWYFLTQFDKKTLSNMIPFLDESTLESFMGDKKVASTDVEDLSIAKVSVDTSTIKEEPVTTAQSEMVSEEVMSVSNEDSTEEQDIENSVEMTQTVEDITPQAVTQTVSIVPVHRLWFGIVNADTQKRENFSISEPYELDVSTNGWLVSTSSAAFSLQDGDEIKEFNDAQEHYFKIDANGIENLSKSDYVALGGWPQW